MTFNIANIDRLAEAANGVTWFDYRTSDTIATVEGANYFATYAKFLDVNDKILVGASDNLIWYRVTVVTAPVNIQGITTTTVAASVTISKV